MLLLMVCLCLPPLSPVHPRACMNTHMFKENELRECLLRMPYGYDNYASDYGALISTELIILSVGSRK